MISVQTKNSVALFSVISYHCQNSSSLRTLVLNVNATFLNNRIKTATLFTIDTYKSATPLIHSHWLQSVALLYVSLVKNAALR